MDIQENEGWRALLARCGGRCPRCGSQDELYPAYIIPPWRGGRPTLANIQPLCVACAQVTPGKREDYRKAA